MKKMACFRLLAALVMLALVLSSGAAGAEIHLDQEPPAEWADREVMTLTAFPTVENDCTLLEVEGSYSCAAPPSTCSMRRNRAR